MNKRFQRDKKNKNIIHMPNLTNKLLNKALNALNTGQYVEAKGLFMQMLDMDPTQEQALYGLAICLIELKAFDQAEALTEDMLEKGQGDYFEVLRLYITVLIQTGQFEKAAGFLIGLLDEVDMSETQRKTYEDLLVFCQDRQSHRDNDMDLDESSRDFDTQARISAVAEADNPMDRWQAITALIGVDVEGTRSVAVPLLLDNKVDPFSKSIMLKVLAENGYSGQIRMEKANHIYSVDIQHAFEPVTDAAKEVKERIAKVLQSENPTICDQVLDIWNHFSYASYPMKLDHPQRWAAVCTRYVHEMNGFEEMEHEIGDWYSVNMSDCQAEYDLLLKYEAPPTSPDIDL